MQLTGPEIERRVKNKNCNDIIIEPFDPKCVGSNSYDLHLDKLLRVYKNTIPKGMKPGIIYDPNKTLSMRDWFETAFDYEDYVLRPENYDYRNPKFLLNPCDDKTHETIDIEIPEQGLVLNPQFGYLGSTVEYTETRNLFPYIDGKSSLGRNFTINHHTAGRGDDGFCGHWTLELKVLFPTVLFPYMRIGQIYYETFIGERKPYDKNKSSHYNKQQGPTPAAAIVIEKMQKTL